MVFVELIRWFRVMPEYLKPKIKQPEPDNPLRKTVADYIAALESGDSKRIAAASKRLNQVGFSPGARRREIERQAKATGNAKLLAAIEMVKQQVLADIEAKQKYLPNRPWRLDTQLTEIAMASRKPWQHFGEK